MLKKRFILFLLLFAFLVVIFNFSLVSASLGGASKVRMLSLSIILSIFEIILAVLVFFAFFKSADVFSKKEKQLSSILTGINDGIIVYNHLNEILFLNGMAEQILGITFKDVASLRFSKESSLRNSKLEKLVGVVFFSKLDSGEGKNFVIESKNLSDKLFLKTLKRGAAVERRQENDIEFITTAAHQLRTPLSGIKWVLKMLLENPSFNQDQISLLKKGQDTNEKAIKIVNDLLDTTKIESGKISYAFKNINPVSFIENSVGGLSGLAQEKSVRLTFDKGSDTIPEIKADPDRLSMALENLLDNAIKYSPSNGEVKITVVRKNNFAEISVADNGIGIPETEIGKVFSKFFRAGNAAKVDGGGAGLGLFIAYRTVADHGGQMRYLPNSPQGSIFSFTIPFSSKF